MTLHIARLSSRALIRVAGPDARPFLQGLLTQDVETLAPGDLRFGALLSAPGRLLFDLFLWGEDEAVAPQACCVAIRSGSALRGSSNAERCLSDCRSPSSLANSCCLADRSR